MSPFERAQRKGLSLEDAAEKGMFLAPSLDVSVARSSYLSDSCDLRVSSGVRMLPDLVVCFYYNFSISVLLSRPRRSAVSETARVSICEGW